MAAHCDPFVVVQRAGLQENGVGHPHLADVVEQRPAPDMDHLGFGDADGPRQPQGHFGDTARVAFGLVIAQVKGAGPAFNRRIVGVQQLVMQRENAFLGPLALGDVTHQHLARRVGLCR